MEIIRIPNSYLNENTFLLLAQKNECVVVDPGLDHELIMNTIRKNNLHPKAILITHGHFDHIYSVDHIKDQYPECQVFVHEEDLEFLYDAVKNASYWHNEFALKTKNVTTFVDEQILKLLDWEIRVRNLKGHTPGSTFFFIEKANVIFTGDTLIKDGLGITHLYGGNRNKMLETAEKIKNINDKYVVYPGHGDLTTIGEEKNNNKELMFAWSQYKPNKLRK